MTADANTTRNVCCSIPWTIILLH